MKETKCYYVRYCNRGDKQTRTCLNGPWDYYRNAIRCRNLFFEQSPDMVACWIEESNGPSRGKRLERL
jgi:hypothetical protein